MFAASFGCCRLDGLLLNMTFVLECWVHQLQAFNGALTPPWLLSRVDLLHIVLLVVTKLPLRVADCAEASMERRNGFEQTVQTQRKINNHFHPDTPIA